MREKYYKKKKNTAVESINTDIDGYESESESESFITNKYRQN